MGKPLSKPGTIDWSNSKREITAAIIQQHREELKSATTINLENCQLSCEAAIDLADILANSRFLTSLNLNDNPDIGPFGIREITSKLRYCPQLEILKLKNTGSFEKSIKAQHKIIKNLRAFYRLETFPEKNQDEEAEKNPNSNTVDASKPSSDSKATEAQKKSNHEEIVIGNTKKFIYVDIDPNQFSMEKHRGSQFEIKKLAAIIKQSNKVKQAIESIEHNEELDLSHCNISKTQLKYLIGLVGLNSTLPIKKIILNNNKIDNDAIPYLCALIKKCPNLTELNLADNQLGPEGVRRLALTLPATLKNLNLRSCGITDKCFAAINVNLKKLVNLSALNLSCNSLGVKTAKLIAESLTAGTIFPKLERLVLSMNSLHSKGFKYICESLSGNKTLKLLGLGFNAGKDAGAKHVAELIRNNSSIISLDIECNLMSDNALCKINQALKRNYHLYLVSTRANGFDHGSANDKLELNIEFDGYINRNQTLRKYYTAKEKSTDASPISKKIQAIETYLAARHQESRSFGLFGYSTQDYTDRKQSFDEIHTALTNGRDTKEQILALLTSAMNTFKGGYSHRYADLLQDFSDLLQVDFIDQSHFPVADNPVPKSSQKTKLIPG